MPRSLKIVFISETEKDNATLDLMTPNISDVFDSDLEAYLYLLCHLLFIQVLLVLYKKLMDL